MPNTDPYGPMGSGYGELTYPSFTEGGVTFGTIPSFDFNANDGGQNPLPTVTDSAGTTVRASAVRREQDHGRIRRRRVR